MTFGPGFLVHCVFFSSGRDFIAPCKCKGTTKYVHRECLDQWRAVKVSTFTMFLHNVSDMDPKLLIDFHVTRSFDMTMHVSWLKANLVWRGHRTIPLFYWRLKNVKWRCKIYLSCHNAFILFYLLNGGAKFLK